MSRITGYAASTSLAGNDYLVVVDVDDLSMASSGTTKKLLVSDLKTFVTSGPVTANAQPANPAATASLSLVMMGMGGVCKITPGSSGKVLVAWTGEVTTATAIASASFSPRYGTGTAPVNGAAVSGTRWGASSEFFVQPPAISANVPWAFTDILALSPGTNYWFDIALGTSNAADSASVARTSFTALEVS